VIIRGSWMGIKREIMKRQLYKEPEAIKAYYVGQSSNSSYFGTKPFCNICKRHHPGPYTMDCRVVTPGANNSCFNCGEKGHFRRDCPLFMDLDTEQEHEEVLMITDGNDHEDPNFDTGTPLLNHPN
jgi:hypothetical protein